jgi:hypothetical protein
MTGYYAAALRWCHCVHVSLNGLMASLAQSWETQITPLCSKGLHSRDKTSLVLVLTEIWVRCSCLGIRRVHKAKSRPGGATKLHFPTTRSLPASFFHPSFAIFCFSHFLIDPIHRRLPLPVLNLCVSRFLLLFHSWSFESEPILASLCLAWLWCLSLANHQPQSSEPKLTIFFIAQTGFVRGRKLTRLLAETHSKRDPLEPHPLPKKPTNPLYEMIK